MVSPGRAARPDRFRPARSPAAGASPDPRSAGREPGPPRPCPFCPGHEAETPPEVARTGDGDADGRGWRVRVVPNRYPIVTGGPRPLRATGSRFHDSARATGVHEVAVMSPDHGRGLADLSGVEVEELFEVLAERVRSHLGTGHEYVQVLVNHGPSAGASIEHPHAQLVAIDLLPPVVETELSHVAGGGECSVCRAVSEDADATSPLFVASRAAAPIWCPWWSSAPFEMMVAHRNHAPRLDQGRSGLGDVARSLAEAAGLLRAAVGDVDYNLAVHSAPASAHDFHWHVHLWPRLSVQAGFEQGTGVLVNSLPPEEAAGSLRDAGASR